MSKKKENAAVTVYTLQRTKLSQTDVDNFNAQYPKLDVKYTRVFHDRFLILDKTKAYHVGASLKDAGKKCFGINLIEDAGIVRCFLQPLITPKCRMPSKKLQWEIPHFCMCLQRSFYAGEMSLQTYFCF